MRRRRDRRGRPRKATAKRHQTTLAGRRGQIVVDQRTPQLRARKIRTTTRPDLELTAVGVLHSRGHLDQQQYAMLAELTLMLQRLTRGWAAMGGVDGLWRGIVAALTHTKYRPGVAPGSGPADAARRQLARALAKLDGSRPLVVALVEERVPPLVLRAIEHRLTGADEAALEGLRLGLDPIAGRR
jgi:hypothetical protein